VAAPVHATDVHCALLACKTSRRRRRSIMSASRP